MTGRGSVNPNDNTVGNGWLKTEPNTTFRSGQRRVINSHVGDTQQSEDAAKQAVKDQRRS